ncbi:hypothetical protein Trydic_g17382 [Trypoxylus dichotomus]
MENTISPNQITEIRQISVESTKTSCRLCLAGENLSNSIFEVYFEECKLSDLLYYCTSIRITEDDSLTHKICTDCIFQLVTVYKFIQKCCTSNELLRSLIVEDNEIVCCDNLEVKDTCDGDENSIDAKIDPLDCSAKDSNQAEYNPQNVERNKIGYKSVKRKLKRKVPEKTKLRCLKCRKNFVGKHEFEGHVCVCKSKKLFQCELCSTSFNLLYNLKRHQKTHTGEKPFTCDVCGKGFIQKISMQEHIRVHTGERPYVCNICGAASKRSQDLKIHLTKHSSSDNSDIENLQNESKTFQCKTCLKTTPSLRALRLHRSINHSKKGYLCSICGKGFVAKQGLDSHIKTHTGEKPFICEFCSKRFAHKTSLNDHILIHTGEKPHACKVCARKFIQRHHLAQHMRIHSGERPYACPFCERSFALKANLTVHMRIHTGETPYVCDGCDFGFYESRSLKKHKIKCGHSRKDDANVVDDENCK